VRLRSLRGRLLVSSLLWTVGLLFVSAVPFTLLMEQQSRLRVAMLVHRFLQSPVVIGTAVFCMIAGTDCREGRPGVGGQPAHPFERAASRP